MAVPTKTIFFGRFISAPNPGPTAALEINQGAVLVAYRHPLSGSSSPPSESLERVGDGDERRNLPFREGVIERVDWTVESVEEARRSFGVDEEREGEGKGEADVVDVVTCAKEGFFFPGFVGE